MYGHGFATMFLAECYGMSPRPELRDKLDQAVKLIVNCQNKDGGWRYQPVKADADHLGDRLPDHGPARGAQRRHRSCPTKPSTVHRLRQTQPERRRRLHVHAPQAARARSRVRRPAWSHSTAPAFTKGRNSTKGLDYLMHVSARRRCARARELLFLRPLLRRPGDVAGRRKTFRQVVSGHPRRPRLETARRRFLVSGESIDEYATAMACIILQMPNNYLPIFQR